MDPPLALQIHEELLAQIATGHIRPPIGQILDFDQAAEAYRLLDTRQAVGKVLVRMRPDPQ
jgi:NADPH:quinone reductase-like Zn-dependent oxidoreductase